MNLTLWGGLLGGSAAFGLLLAVATAAALRRPRLSVRVMPYVRDLPQVSRRELALQPSGSVLAGC